jgi:hypothetical protein
VREVVLSTLGCTWTVLGGHHPSIAGNPDHRSGAARAATD